MTSRWLRRHAHRTAGALAPRLAARWATDVFSSTRTYGLRPDDVLPLGAVPFTVQPRAADAGGDPAEAAHGALRLALLPDDGPTGGFFSWDGTPVPW
ncbi:hypothetical protein GTY20_22255 [Streptomyces sp. SID4946]|nr:hypothetical protein [Streptomyces sp. SID4946]SCF84756.1 hypothetical protein GA0115256_12389 [Streptomyces sp. DconLS]